MISTILPISSLLLGAAILLSGTGLFATLLAVRGTLEGFSETALGLIVSAYFVGFLVGTYACPAIIRRVGHIRAYALFAAVASITPIWHGLIIEPWIWGILRVLTGVCLVGLYTVIESWLNAQAPNEKRGQVFSTYMIVNFLGLAAGQFLLLVRPPGLLDLFGIVATLFSLSLVPVALTSMVQPPPVGQPHPSLRKLHRTAPAGAAGALVSGLAVSAFWGLAPVMAQQLDLGIGGVAVFMSATILGGAAMQYPIGRYSDRHDRVTVLGAISAGAGATAILAYVAAPFSFVLLVGSMVLFGGLAFSIYSVSVAHLNDRLRPEETLSGSSGLLLLHGVGAAVGPAIAGVVMNQIGATGLLAYCATVLIVMALYVRWSPPPAPVPELHPVAFTPMVRTTPVALEMLPEVPPPDPGPGQAPPPAQGTSAPP